MREDGLTSIPVTDTPTVTEHVAVLLPSSVVTVMVALPALTPLTVAADGLLLFELTVATDVLLLFQLTFLLAASEGNTSAVRVTALPTPSDTVAGLTDTLDTCIIGFAFWETVTIT